jgi:hypothetical protein
LKQQGVRTVIPPIRAFQKSLEDGPVIPEGALVEKLFKKVGLAGELQALRKAALEILRRDMALLGERSEAVFLDCGHY